MLVFPLNALAAPEAEQVAATEAEQVAGPEAQEQSASDEADEGEQEAPTPEAAPEPAGGGDSIMMPIMIIASVVVALGGGITLLAVAYSTGDPADNPDPSLTAEEQDDEELNYNRTLSYGWGFTIIGTLMVSLLVLAFASVPDDPEPPGLSLGDDIRLIPLFGEAWGAGLRMDF